MSAEGESGCCKCRRFLSSLPHPLLVLTWHLSLLQPGAGPDEPTNQYTESNICSCIDLVLNNTLSVTRPLTAMERSCFEVCTPWRKPALRWVSLPGEQLFSTLAAFAELLPPTLMPFRSPSSTGAMMLLLSWSSLRSPGVTPRSTATALSASPACSWPTPQRAYPLESARCALPCLLKEWRRRDAFRHPSRCAPTVSGSDTFLSHPASSHLFLPGLCLPRILPGEQGDAEGVIWGPLCSLKGARGGPSLQPQGSELGHTSPL